MRISPARLVLVAVLSLMATLALAATASAHGGRGGSGFGRTSAGALVNEAAEELGVAAATLRQAIVNAAIARIDAEVAEGDVDEDDADELKERAQENLRFAIGVSRTRTVASNLGITVQRLNTGFRDARRTLILEQINEAVEEGELDEDDAAELREELEDAELPGYKAADFRGLGYGGGRCGR